MQLRYANVSTLLCSSLSGIPFYFFSRGGPSSPPGISLIVSSADVIIFKRGNPLYLFSYAFHSLHCCVITWCRCRLPGSDVLQYPAHWLLLSDRHVSYPYLRLSTPSRVQRETVPDVNGLYWLDSRRASVRNESDPWVPSRSQASYPQSSSGQCKNAPVTYVTFRMKRGNREERKFV